ncbi:MAG TPA: hypothetical protein VGF85_02185 [Opitutaceae bacterium]|jgi:hypothetical protein
MIKFDFDNEGTFPRPPRRAPLRAMMTSIIILGALTLFVVWDSAERH